MRVKTEHIVMKKKNSEETYIKFTNQLVKLVDRVEELEQTKTSLMKDIKDLSSMLGTLSFLFEEKMGKGSKVMFSSIPGKHNYDIMGTIVGETGCFYTLEDEDGKKWKRGKGSVEEV